MVLDNLEPKAVLKYFEEISAIPRGSGNEEAVAKYVENFGKSLGLFTTRDEANNVFIRKEATMGRENDPAVCMQGHLDMVCEANADVDHDFLKDGIKLILNGDTLTADGTTLGADDGIAVAMMMAILESTDLSHPMIECIFTTDEETGMSGMRAFDTNLVQSRMMINLDSEDEGLATVSCAGGVRCNFAFPIIREKADGTAVKVTVSGLFGGHSGGDINLGRSSANKLLARVLYVMQRDAGIKLSYINGGSKDNAISRESYAIFVASDIEKIREIAEKEATAISSALCAEDKGFKITVDTAEADTVISGGERLINLFNIIPFGVHAMSNDIKGLVETSSNLGVIKTEADAVRIAVSCRSSIEGELDYLQEIMESAAALSGCTVEHKSRYPGWAFVNGSKLQNVYLDTFKAMYNREAKIIGIHAGLECGLFVKRVPDMDIISIGADVKNLHSPDESLNIPSLERMYRLVCKMLENIK